MRETNFVLSALSWVRIVIVSRSTSRRLPVAAGVDGTGYKAKAAPRLRDAALIEVALIPYGPITLTSFEQFLVRASHT